MQRALLIGVLALAGVSRIQLPSAEARPAGAATVHHTCADDAYEMDDWRRAAELYFALPDRTIVEAPRSTSRNRPTSSV